MRNTTERNQTAFVFKRKRSKLISTDREEQRDRHSARQSPSGEGTEGAQPEQGQNPEDAGMSRFSK